MIPTERPQTRLRSRPIIRDDTRFVATKLTVFQVVMVLIFLFLLSGYWELQVSNPDFYSERAERNRIKALPLLAARGRILDRDGRVLVDNHASFSLILSRENLTPEQLHTISDGLNLDYDELAGRIERFDRSHPKYEPVIIKEELTPGELAFVSSHRNSKGFPEMELIHAHKRLYPQGGVAAHVIGYVGEVSESELNQLEFVQYRQGDVIGKAGIERQYNRTLMGTDGQRRVVVDSLGREQDVIGARDAIPGQDVVLSIDLDLQVVAELALRGRRGAVVALDPRTGGVLAMVSQPAYDPNKFAGRIRSRDWAALIENPEKPLFNRAIQAQLAPGSTFKPVMALAGLELGVINEEFHANCKGGATFYNHFFGCHEVHGRVSLHRALARSCDVFFYQVGNRIGIDNIAKYSEMVGFGEKTGIDLPGEAAGLVPSTKWKLRTFRQKWYAGETISVAIGQGALTITPLQLAYAIGGLAIGGIWHRPHLVDDPESRTEPRVASFNVNHAVQIVTGMWAVVNDGGTGLRAAIPGIEVCGKTGTAQLASNAVLRNTKLGETLKDNAWFVGFAPRENPEIVVAVLFEGGEHGHFAAPIARDVIKAYFDKKQRGISDRLIAAASAPAPAGPGRRP